METLRTVLENVGRRIIEVRLSRGWTQEACAERLRLDVRLLRRIEGGRHNLTVSTLVRLARGLEVATLALFQPAQMQLPRTPGRRPRGAEADRAAPAPASPPQPHLTRSLESGYPRPSPSEAVQAVAEKPEVARSWQKPRPARLKKKTRQTKERPKKKP